MWHVSGMCHCDMWPNCFIIPVHRHRFKDIWSRAALQVWPQQQLLSQSLGRKWWCRSCWWSRSESQLPWWTASHEGVLTNIAHIIIGQTLCWMDQQTWCSYILLASGGTVSVWQPNGWYHCLQPPGHLQCVWPRLGLRLRPKSWVVMKVLARLIDSNCWHYWLLSWLGQ